MILFLWKEKHMAPGFSSVIFCSVNDNFYTLLIFLRQRGPLSSRCYLLIMKYCRSCPFLFTTSSCWTRCERLLFLNRCIKVRVGKVPPTTTSTHPPSSIMSSESKRHGWRKIACFTHDRHLNTWSKWSGACGYFSLLQQDRQHWHSYTEIHTLIQ